ncbi:MAG: branched-chain amino acid ABC transporter permease [Inquilinus sp.]|nr:branched-chain amino acid ABC transporter permease [Inquilinus sp.]
MMQYVADGIVFAAIISLGAIGLSMIYNILRFANFAQGEIVAAGAYFALAFVALLGAGVGAMGPVAFGWPLLVSMGFAMAATSTMVLLVDWLLFRQLRDKNASRIALIMAAFGVSLMGRNIVTLAAGGDPINYTFYIPRSIELLPGLRLVPDDLAIIAIAALSVLALHLFLSRTTMGRWMRATAENPTLARINGIDTRVVIRWTWIIGASLATIAGTLQGHIVELRPEMGFSLLLPMFAALILGGVGNVYGTVLGAIVVGVSQSLAVAIGLSAYREAVAFMLMLAILLVRPQGLLGERE